MFKNLADVDALSLLNWMFNAVIVTIADLNVTEFHSSNGRSNQIPFRFAEMDDKFVVQFDIRCHFGLCSQNAKQNS